ncbi:MAG: malate dehydrogenase, partial [Nanoarchaeota archaeon]|nr:malate dehydrogenase [Nanoarchaeota archaeon]
DNAKIIKGIADEIKAHSKGAILITTTNPIDAINYVLWKETGFAREKIIGFGGLLDSSRFKAMVSEELNIPANSIVCEVLGEHGENMTPLFSRMTIDGKSTALSSEQTEKIRIQLLGTAKTVIEKKGATEYGPTSQLLRIVDAIVNNKKEVLLCSCVLQGEYGLSDVSIGAPAVIGARGIEKIEVWQIDSDELERLRRAGEKIKADVGAAMK